MDRTELYRNCRLCPRECKVDRRAGKTGFCGMTSEVMAARAALHFWEEPCISGTEGSGAVFFSGCTLRCVFCQNHEIAAGAVGKPVTEERLSRIFLELQEKGANNINLVTATQFLPTVIPALQHAKKMGLTIPIVYNTGGYEKVETLRLLEELVDIWLPDCKYRSAELAARYSRAADYPETVKTALAKMVRQTGAPLFDRRGMMKKGVIVRHLLLPGHVKNGKAVVKYVLETYGKTVWISLMNQYTPLEQTGRLERFPELQRKVTRREYERLLDYAIDLGLENGFIQEGKTAEESFIPAFDYEGL